MAKSFEILRAGWNAAGTERRFVPADATIAELERKAAECERLAEGDATAEAAAKLREEAKGYREWAQRLRSGIWKA